MRSHTEEVISSDEIKTKKRKSKTQLQQNASTDAEICDVVEEPKKKKSRAGGVTDVKATLNNESVKMEEGSRQEASVQVESVKNAKKHKKKKSKFEEVASEGKAASTNEDTVPEKGSNEEGGGHDSSVPAEPVEAPKKKRKPRTRIPGKPPEPPRINKKKKKKKKKGKKVVTTKEEDYFKELGLQYLKQWKEQRDVWKFHKLRQIWLLDNMFDESKISDEIFPTFVEYAAGAKGQFVKIILEKAQTIIKSMEDSQEIDVKNTKYARSREILQSLGEDT